MSAWVKANKDTIDAAISLIGAVGAIIALAFTGVQVKQGSEALRASTLYETQKDGRALFTEVSRNPDFSEYVIKFDKNKTYDLATILNAKTQVGLILQWYSSIFNQKRFNTLTQETWATAHQDLCGFLAREPIRSLWKTEYSISAFSKEFRAEGDRCLKP